MCGFTTTLTGLSFDRALEKTIDALGTEGFGVLSDIDGGPGCVVVGFLDPHTMVDLVGKPEIQLVADQADQRLRRACAGLGGNAAV